MQEERFVTVTDDWSPCYPNNKILLRLYLSERKFNNLYLVRLSAWGLDDTGMIYDMESENWEEALRYYNLLLDFFYNVPENVNKEWFSDHGFERF
jgi:hypothetical protein